MRFILTFICILTAGSLHAQSAQFTVEVRDADGETLAVLSESDAGFKVGFFDPDLIQVSGKAWTMRWAGRFETPQSPENLDLVGNNTFITFTHSDVGEVSCRPADTGAQPNSWTRNINRDALKAGFLNFELGECKDALGARVELPGLPLMVQGAYMLEK